jgi:hypothetical protein
MLFHAIGKFNPITPKRNYTATATISETLDFTMILKTNPQNGTKLLKTAK